MKLKLQRVIQIKRVFSPLIRVKLPSKLAYKIFKFIQAVELEEKFFSEKIREIANEYGQRDTEGKFLTDEQEQLVIQADKRESFDKAMSELNEVEVEIPDISFTVDELSPIPLSILDMELLKDFIKEDANG